MPLTATVSDQTSKGRLSLNALMMLVLFAFSGLIFLGLGIRASLVVYGIGAILLVTTIAFVLYNVRRPAEVGVSENEKTRDTLHHLFLLLYVQFCYYWGTFAAGMYTNYYYVIPRNLQPTLVSIVSDVILAPDLFTHVLMAILSTSMSIPVIYLARKVRLKNVVSLHAAAIGVRSIGFVMGPLFLFSSTFAINNLSIASPASLTMASVFAVAVFLTLLSRIFIVREDVRLKSAEVLQRSIQLSRGSDGN